MVVLSSSGDDSILWGFYPAQALYQVWAAIQRHVERCRWWLNRAQCQVDVGLIESCVNKYTSTNTSSVTGVVGALIGSVFLRDKYSQRWQWDVDQMCNLLRTLAAPLCLLFRAEREWLLEVQEQERGWISPFPKFGNGKGRKKSIPKAREQERVKQFHCQNSRMKGNENIHSRNLK